MFRLVLHSRIFIETSHFKVDVDAAPFIFVLCCFNLKQQQTKPKLIQFQCKYLNEGARTAKFLYKRQKAGTTQCVNEASKVVK
jgi:hypothetical protein